MPTLEEKARQKLLAEATRLANDNSFVREKENENNLKFDDLIQRCTAKIKEEVDRKNTAEAEEWRKLQHKIQHIKTNA